MNLHDASEEQFDKVLCGISALRLRWSTTQPMHQRGSADNTDLLLDDLTAEVLAKIYK
ncbi:MAG: hypothetical protein ACREXX_21945 [Gammaproteobacteria bacterium]